MVKKHHWLLHFHQMLQHHQIIPGCFRMERKNKVPGRIATGIQNMRRVSNRSTWKSSLWNWRGSRALMCLQIIQPFLTPSPVGKSFFLWLLPFGTGLKTFAPAATQGFNLAPAQKVILSILQAQGGTALMQVRLSLSSATRAKRLQSSMSSQWAICLKHMLSGMMKTPSKLLI